MTIDPQTIEAALRDALHTSSSPVAAWPDPVTRVEAGVTRRRRRRMLVASAAAVLVAGTAVAGTGFLTHRPVPATVAVGSETAAAPQIQRRSPRADRQACKLDDVDSAEWIVQSAPWGLSTGLAVRPHTSERCTLSGTPLLSGVNAATGVSEPITVADAGALDGDVVRQFPATIDPGEVARIEVGGTKCDAGQKSRSYRNLVLTVGTKKIALPSSRHLDRVCGAAVSKWFVEPPMLYAALNATLQAPATLRRGEDFTYTVKVSNSYPSDYSLSECPTFELGIGATEIGSWQRVNCTQERIDGHDSLTFTLYGTIPADTEPGRHKLTWLAVTSTGEAVVADMETSGAPVEISK